MKWKDIKLATLQKMFSAEGNNIPSDDSTRDYLAGMPYTANEGLMMMCTDKRHIVKSVDIDNTMGEPVGGFLRCQMRELATDFYEFSGEVYYTEGIGHKRTQAYRTEAQDVLVLPMTFNGVYTVYYNAFPETITSTTEDEYELKAPVDVQVLLPLYMASQLYKEDDNGIATSLRNEFEVAYERLAQNNPMCTYEPMDESGW